MTKFLAVCCLAIVVGFAVQASAQEKQALRLVQTIPLPGVKGRLDHIGDGKLYLEYTLPATVSGRIGLWSKADSYVHFADYTVTPAN
jgi:hypothetical protein